MNVFDSVLNGVITRFLTKDEWHTVVVGFFDGLSFGKDGRYMRKALAKPGVSVEGIDTEKSWYYRPAYSFGELVKVLVALRLGLMSFL